MISIVLLILILQGKSGSTLADSTSDMNNVPLVTRRISSVDALLEKLDEVNLMDQFCLKSMKDMLLGVKEDKLWATWIWDSMQYPVGTLYGSRYQLGNFDQCIKPPWIHTYPEYAAQYCLVDIKFLGPVNNYETDFDAHVSTKVYYNTSTQLLRHLNLLTWGLCLPSKCKPESVSTISRLMYEDTHLPKDKLDFKVHSCQKAGEDIEFERSFYLFILLLIILTAISIFATFWDVDKKTASLGIKFIKSFDIKRNLDNLFRTNEDQIHSINGVKTLICIGMVLKHYGLNAHMLAVNNRLDSDRFYRHVVHFELWIITFFALSGILHMNGMMSTRKNPFYSLMKRYLRLIFPLGVIVFFMSSVMRYIGSGPLWPLLQISEEKPCRDNWWLAFLMINNYIKSDEMCHIATWYVSCDFQLAVFGAIIYWIYHNNIKFGKLVFGLAIIVSALLPPYITYVKKLPAILIYNYQPLKKNHFSVQEATDKHIKNGKRRHVKEKLR